MEGNAILFLIPDFGLIEVHKKEKRKEFEATPDFTEPLALIIVRLEDSYRLLPC